jgi:hypothetical protein
MQQKICLGMRPLVLHIASFKCVISVLKKAEMALTAWFSGKLTNLAKFDHCLKVLVVKGLRVFTGELFVNDLLLRP